MFVLAKRNIVLPAPDRSEFFRLRKDEFSTVPEHFTTTPYFSALVRDGKIVSPDSRKDAAIDEANAVAEVKLAEKLEDQQTAPEEKAEITAEKKRGRKKT